MPRQKVTIEMLVAYAAGELDPDAVARMEAHLASSPQDAAKLKRIRATIETMRTDDSSAAPTDTLTRAQAIFKPEQTPAWRRWLQDLEQVVASLIFDSRAQPALVGYRGGSDVVQLSFETEVASIDLELTSAGAVRDMTWTVMGQISPHDTELQLVVVLVSQTDDTIWVEVETDEHGVFTLQSPPGMHKLLIRFADRLVVLPNISLN